MSEELTNDSCLFQADSNVFYLSDLNGIFDSNFYSCLTNLRKGNTDEDHIKIFINSNGGELYQAYQIMNAVNECPKPVIMIADGAVISASSLIFFSGTSAQVNPYSFMIIHHVSTSQNGKVKDVLNSINFTMADTVKLFENLYLPFLTKKELKSIFSGLEIYLDANEIISRLAKVETV